MKKSKQEKELKKALKSNSRVVMNFLKLDQAGLDELLREITDDRGMVVDRERWSLLHHQFDIHERSLKPIDHLRNRGGVGKAFSNVVVLRQLVLNDK